MESRELGEVSHKIKNTSLHHPAGSQVHVWPNRNETSKVKEAPVADTLTAALFTVATCTQASVHQLMNGLKMWYMCMAEYYTAMKRIKCCYDNKDGSRSCSISIERNHHMTSTSECFHTYHKWNSSYRVKSSREKETVKGLLEGMML